MAAEAARERHWDDRYLSGARSVSWYESEPTWSLAVMERIGAEPEDSVVDIGGGASALVGALQRRGFGDLSVLDISEAALNVARERVDRPDEITWIQGDLLRWRPARTWRVWHDRAVFHFLTGSQDRAVYRTLLRTAVEPDGFVVIATFADDGPTTCSGLPVCRYTADELVDEIGPGFDEVARGRFDHVTPVGAIQPFTWIAARRPG